MELDHTCSVLQLGYRLPMRLHLFLWIRMVSLMLEHGLAGYLGWVMWGQRIRSWRYRYGPSLFPESVPLAEVPAKEQ